MLLTVAPPVCVAKYSTTKTTEHTHTDTQHGTLKPNSVNAVRLKNKIVRGFILFCLISSSIFHNAILIWKLFAV